MGKGGVGKTTVAAATGVRAAELGYRTLIVSTDIAHSLGDVLDVQLSGEPEAVADRLYAQEINVLEEARRSWGKVQGRMAEVLRREGISDIQADELAIVPGMEEVAALVQIGRKMRTGEFDCIVVDAAPTGETVRLLTMPESFQWYASRIEEWRARLAKYLPILRGIIPDLNVADAMRQLADRVRDLRTAMTDPRQSSYRIVVTPDAAVLKEARRAETYLNLFEYPIDAVIVNRILRPPQTQDPYLQALIDRQQTILTEVRNTFATLPVLEAPLEVQEPAGVAALSALAQRLFGDVDPTLVLHTGATQSIERRGDVYVLCIPMPNVEIRKLSLVKRGDELYVDVGNFRREITLPMTLAALEPGVARVHGGNLEIPFAMSEDDEADLPREGSPVHTSRG